MAGSPTQQRNAISEGIALGLLMCDCNEIPYNKVRVDLAFESAWQKWAYRRQFSQVDTDLRKGLGGSLVMTRANETKKTFVLFWARERSLLIYQRADDWDPNDPADVDFALSVIDDVVPLQGWVSLANGFLDSFER